MPKIEVQSSDLLKIYDALEANEKFHLLRDEMNAAIHKSEPRYSPLTTTTTNEKRRLAALLTKDGILVETKLDPRR